MIRTENLEKATLSGSGALVVQGYTDVASFEAWSTGSGALTREPTRDTPGWADLLLRVFGEDVLVCRHCRGPLSLRAVGVYPPATTRILDGLARARAPPMFTGA